MSILFFSFCSSVVFFIVILFTVFVLRLSGGGSGGSSSWSWRGNRSCLCRSCYRCSHSNWLCRSWSRFRNWCCYWLNSCLLFRYIFLNSLRRITLYHLCMCLGLSLNLLDLLSLFLYFSSSHFVLLWIFFIIVLVLCLSFRLWFQFWSWTFNWYLWKGLFWCLVELKALQSQVLTLIHITALIFQIFNDRLRCSCHTRDWTLFGIIFFVVVFIITLLIFLQFLFLQANTLEIRTLSKIDNHPFELL